MCASLVRRMKELEAENTRLKKTYVEERIKSELRQEALEVKVLGHLPGVRWPRKRLANTA